MNLNEQNPPYGVSMTGKVRENNEDSFLYTNESTWLNQLAVVCDGIGGSMHGEIASYLCCKYFYEIWEERKAMFIEDAEEMKNFMFDTLAEVNKKSIQSINLKIFPNLRWEQLLRRRHSCPKTLSLSMWGTAVSMNAAATENSPALPSIILY